MNDRLYLCGMMGSGKSTVALLVARALGWSVVDIDTEAERLAGLSVAQIFHQASETEFRKLERQILVGVQKKTGLVVALGGGSLSHAADAIRGFGILVHLRARTDTLRRRLAGEGAKLRPLIDGLMDPTAKLEEISQARAADYALADFSVPTDEQSPVEISQRILKELGR